MTLYKPVNAVTPGQIAAFYDPAFRQLLGGGYIEKNLPHRVLDEQGWREKREHLPDLYCQVTT